MGTNKTPISEQLYQDIFKYSPLGIYTLDCKGIITSFNPKMSEISGDTEKEALGLNVFELESYKKAGLDKYFAKGLKGHSFEVEVEYISQLSNKPSVRYYRGVPLSGNSKPGQAKLLLIVEDVTMRRKAEAKLEESRNEERLERERLLALINSVADGVIALDDDHNIIEYNGAALNLLDVNETVAGKKLSHYFNITDKNNVKLKINDIITETTTTRSFDEWLLHYRDGEVINIHVSIAPVHLGYGKLGGRGHVLLLRDITKEKSLEEERDEFISVVSHELRTPIAIAEGNISNALFVSEKHHDPKSVISSLNEAHDKVVFLAKMINDLATLSRAERAGTKMEVTATDPRELLESLAADYEVPAKEKGLQLTMSVAEGTKPIETSALYLREILQNFITNSIKYTKTGSIFLHVRSNKAGDAVFSVADTGIGISKSDKTKVFDKFFRSEDYRTRESSGTGLGLYVTAKLAHRLNANIELESHLNKGSTFTITVPSIKRT